MLLDVVSKFKGFITLGQEVVLDDTWDQLNRSFMFLIMAIFGAVVTVRGHVGNIIKCDGFKKFSSGFVEDYCWTQGLYTIREAYDKPQWNIPYPGIIPEDVPACIEVELENGGRLVCPPESDIKKPTRVDHLWYQWVPFYFWLAAGAFYLPHVLFRLFGFAELKGLVDMVHAPLLDEEEMQKTIKKAGGFLYNRCCVYMKGGWGLNGFIQKHRLGLITVVCKGLYLLTSVVLFILTQRMFQVGNFFTYGPEWMLRYPEGGNASTLVKDKLFPKMIACEVKRWGSTGLEQERGMCVLAPNVINQYLFLLEWYLLVFIMAANIFSFLWFLIKLAFVYAGYRRMLVTAFLPHRKMIKRLYYSVGSTGRMTLHILANNVRPRVFEGIVNDLSARLHKVDLLEELEDDEELYNKDK